MSGSKRARIQHSCADNGYSLHAPCRILLLGKRRARYVWSLRTSKSYIHSFHQSDQAICRWVTLLSVSQLSSDSFVSFACNQMYSLIVNLPQPSLSHLYMLVSFRKST